MTFFHRIILVLLLFRSAAHVSAGPIVELRSISELPGILESLGEQSPPLVVFDIHGTLIEARGSAGVGSDAWIASLLARGVSFPLVCDAWAELQMGMELTPVEPQTSQIVNQLTKNHTVVALTGGLVSLVDTYHAKLSNQGINLSRSPPPFDMNQTLYVPNKKRSQGLEQVIYRNGIFAVGPHVSKGEALAQILESWSYRPRTVVFIDDNKKYLWDVIDHLPETFNVVPLHYTGSTIPSWFSPQNADAELQRFSSEQLPSGNACAKVFDFLNPDGR